MSPSTSAVLLLVALNAVSAWPGMKPPKSADSEYFGPACTVGAHNWHPESGDCPNMEQPPAPAPYSGNVHTWPSQFVVDWKFYFVPDDSDVPPYTPLPKTDYNVTTGKSYYYNNEATGERNMKEVYDEYCIPVFGNPVSSMGRQNKYSCDFLNVGSTNISYVVLHEDRPRNAPECCIIGQPFHAPPQDFSTAMPIHYTETVEGNVIDWNAIYDKDAGIFNYGFLSNTTGTPFAFYMKGVPWIANWMWQSFTNFQEVAPDASVWEIPAACSTAVACPGW